MVMNIVIQNVYIGSLEDANDAESMAKAKITKIISVGCHSNSILKGSDHLSFESILDKPEQPILQIFEATNSFLKEAFVDDSAVLVHCVYGQSRSAAVIVAYLLSLGESIQSAIALLKEKRQIICINPGFLAQLYLLSMKGIHAPEVKLILQNPLRYDSTKLSSAGNTNEEHRSDYVDSYKTVSGGKKRPLGGTGVEDESDSRNSCVGDRLQSSDPSLHADSVPKEGVNSDCSSIEEELSCGQCGFILAQEPNIIRATLYVDFLREHTDSYWAGYRAIHPPLEGVIALEGTQLSDKKRIRQNCGKKDQGKSEALSVEPKGMTISVVGPMEWIEEQVESRRRERERQTLSRMAAGGATSRRAAASEGSANDIKLTCPSCRNTCGYCVRGGLEICQSFLRCDLLALTSATIKRTQQVQSIADA